MLPAGTVAAWPIRRAETKCLLGQHDIGDTQRIWIRRRASVSGTDGRVNTPELAVSPLTGRVLQCNRVLTRL
jgi:hypothetical protein